MYNERDFLNIKIEKLQTVLHDVQINKQSDNQSIFLIQSIYFIYLHNDHDIAYNPGNNLRSLSGTDFTISYIFLIDTNGHHETWFGFLEKYT